MNFMVSAKTCGVGAETDADGGEAANCHADRAAASGGS